MRHLDIEAIRARCDAATRGPWTVVALTCPNGNAIVDSITGTGEPQWCDYGEGEGEWYTDSLVIAETDMGVYGPTMPDAQFIAAARTDIPALLAYVEELERELAENDRLRDKEREEWASRRCECSASDSCKMARERDEALAEVERLKAQRLERHLESWEQHMLDNDVRRAYTRGAEAMRLACQEWCRARQTNGEAMADALADLRVEEP